IGPVAIIDRQLPFEYTIASRLSDVMVMALPVGTDISRNGQKKRQNGQKRARK
ncbi:hypothetical protein Tco_1362227, partial [Tanacetum coccineum]